MRRGYKAVADFQSGFARAGLEVEFEIGGWCCAGATIEQLLEQGEHVG